MSKKVLLTGANGMLGSNIVRELLDQGYEVKCLIQKGESIETIWNLPVEFYAGNLLQPKSYEGILPDCDFVIHAAASTSVWPRRNRITREVNITGVSNLVELSKKAGIKRFVYIGSASSFAPGSKLQPGDETNNYDGWKFKMDYLDSKYAAQQLLIKEHEENGFPSIIINPTYMIGPYDSRPSSGKLILSFIKGQIPGFGPGGKNFVCSTDVAKAVVNSLTLGKTGECYIAAGENLSYDEFFKQVAEVANIQYQLKQFPGGLLIFVGLINSIQSSFTRKAPLLSFGMARIGCLEAYYSSQKAVANLNMPQTPIQTGIIQCINWFKQNNYIK